MHSILPTRFGTPRGPYINTDATPCQAVYFYSLTVYVRRSVMYANSRSWFLFHFTSKAAYNILFLALLQDSARIWVTSWASGRTLTLR
jgi:hypothetical protein